MNDEAATPAGTSAPAGAGAGVLRAACVQMNSRDDVAANVRVALELAEAAADLGARLIALPETWAFKGRRDGIRATAEAPDGPANAALAEVERLNQALASASRKRAPLAVTVTQEALF